MMKLRKEYTWGVFVIIQFRNNNYLKSPTFWDITLRGLLKFNRRLEGICFHFQVRRIRQARNPREAGSKQQVASSVCYQLHAGFFLGLFFNTEDGGERPIRNIC
jgi:hypothetical protein